MEDKDIRDNLIKTGIACMYAVKTIEAYKEKKQEHIAMFEPGAEERANKISDGQQYEGEER